MSARGSGILETWAGCAAGDAGYSARMLADTRLGCWRRDCWLLGWCRCVAGVKRE